MAFDVASVRASYPALADGFAYLDGAAGTQVPAAVLDAIGAAYRSGMGNTGGRFPASLRSTALAAECRQAHATPHSPVDVVTLGADFYATSAYKWSGPHVGAVIADPALLESLHPDKLMPARDTVPQRFEQGTLPFADLAAVTAAVEHLAQLDGAGGGPRRQRLLASMAAVETYEQELFGVLQDGLATMSHVTSYGKAANRAPTAYFTVAGHTPNEVAEFLAGRQVNVWAGHNYAWELTGALGLRDRGGAVRAGLVHYNDRSDVDRLLAAVADLAG